MPVISGVAPHFRQRLVIAANQKVWDQRAVAAPRRNAKESEKSM